jgi:hypothetical protein
MADERFRAGAQSRTARAIAPIARDVPRPLATAPQTRGRSPRPKAADARQRLTAGTPVDLGIRTRASEIMSLVLYQSELGQAEVSAPRGGPIRWPAGYAPRDAERADAMARDRNPFNAGVAGQRRAPLGSHQRKVEDLNLTSSSPAHRFRGGPRDPPALAFQGLYETAEGGGLEPHTLRVPAAFKAEPITRIGSPSTPKARRPPGYPSALVELAPPVGGVAHVAAPRLGHARLPGEERPATEHLARLRRPGEESHPGLGRSAIALSLVAGGAGNERCSPRSCAHPCCGERRARTPNRRGGRAVRSTGSSRDRARRCSRARTARP